MKPLYPIACLVIAAGLGTWLLLRPAPGSDGTPAPSATVSAVRAMRQSVPRQIQASGSIIAGTAAQSLTLNAAGILTAYDVVPGEQVSAGQALAQLMPDPMAVAELHKAQDAVTAAQAARDHVVALLSSHLATTADLASTTQVLRDAKAALAALRANGTGQAFTLSAPQAGVVTVLSATPGGSLPAGTALLTLVPDAGLLAQVGLEQRCAALVKPGDAATLTLLNSGGKVAARVTTVAGALDPQTGLINVILRPQKPVTLGAPLAVTIIAGRLDGFIVPNSAVLRDDRGTYVYQLDPGNAAHRENVTVLQQGADESVLAPTLNPAWKVATIGAYQLADGMRATLQGTGP